MRARKLFVSLIGKVRTTHRDSKGDMHTENVTIYDFNMPLDGENDYFNEFYPFEIKIQSDILKIYSSSDQINKMLQEKLGTIGLILGKIATGGQGPIKWMIKAQLDLPMKIDVHKSQDIIISS